MKGLQSRVTAPLLWYCAVDDQYVRSRMIALGVAAEITRRPRHSLLSPLYPTTTSNTNTLTHTNSLSSQASPITNPRESLSLSLSSRPSTYPLPGVRFTLISNYSPTPQSGAFEWKLTATTLKGLEEAEELLTGLIESASAKASHIAFLDFNGTASVECGEMGMDGNPKGYGGRVVQRVVGPLGKTVREVEEKTGTTVKVYRGEGTIVIIGKFILSLLFSVLYLSPYPFRIQARD
jgi:hypothetical protein